MAWAEIKAEWASQNGDPEQPGSPSPVTEGQSYRP
jgi:hypothetical protein